jgi:hypothetical protein
LALYLGHHNLLMIPSGDIIILRVTYMKRISTLVIAAVVVVGLTGCAAAPTQYTLTISSTEGGQVVIPDEGTFTYYEDEAVSLTAVAENGYRFANWAGDVSTVADPNAASTIIMMNGNYSIMANFYEMPVTYYTLTLAVNGNGSTSPSMGQHTYAAGTVVSITAAPVGGYRFVNWTGSVGTVANVIAATTAVTMNADYSIVANFEEGVVIFPNPDAGAATRGDIGERGYLFPSDIQGHNPFH